MKVCNYCGRENGDEGVHCAECGTKEFTILAPDVPNLPPESDPRSWEFRDLRPEDLKMGLVTLMTCGRMMEADVIVGVLRSAGIFAFLPDEFLMQTVGWNLNTFGYVRVQISPNDFEAAKRILLAAPEATEPSVPPNDDPPKPPGSSGAEEGPNSIN